MSFGFRALFSIVALCLCSVSAAAELEAEDESLVSLFVESCTVDNVNADAILDGAITSTDWVEVQGSDLDTRSVTQIPSRLMTGALRRPESVRHFRQTRNDREVNLLIANFPERNAYHHLCVIFVPGIRNAMPYFDAYRDAMSVLGLSGRSTDLPHYMEYSGRLSERRRAHSDIFSRSRLGGESDTMHISIAFQ